MALSRLSASLISALLAAAVSPAAVVVRHFGTEEGLAHDHVRDVIQDSHGYMWFATWTGVDRFDGYGFRNYRSFSGDSVMLDNNRVERVAEDSEGRMWVMTYTYRVYGLDPLTGRFSLASGADSLRFFSLPRPSNAVRGELEGYGIDTPLSFVDSDGNLWLVRRTDGVDFVSAAPDAFRFIDSEPLDPGGRDIHVLYAAPDGRLWAASRDTRVMLYDSATGDWIGNLSPTGKIVRDPRAATGLMVYAVTSDSRGRVWLGTKQKQLAILEPEPSGGYHIGIYDEGDSGLRCADVYAFAEDSGGQMWIGTFGGGVAKAVERPGGGFSFVFPDGYPSDAGRVRRLVAAPGGYMVAATTRGVAVFDPAAGSDSLVTRFYTNDPSGGCSLSNNDILDICVAADGSICFSAYSGGVDRVGSAEELMGDGPVFANRNVRNGLDVDPVLSVVQDAGGDFWVASHSAVARYDSLWNHLATYNAGNAGRSFRITEAEPRHLPGGRLAYGTRGGILIIDPAELEGGASPRFAVTEVEVGGEILAGLPADGVLRLPRGDRDITVRFAALDFAGAANIMYAYSLDGGEWVPLGRERVVRLTSLPSGTTRLRLRWTDPYGVWTDVPFALDIEAPRSWREILGDFSIALCIALLLAGMVVSVRREYRRRRQRGILESHISRALAGKQAADASSGESLMDGFCREVGEGYPDSSLRAEDIARRLGIGRNELRREVKAAVGISLEDFLRVVRVRAASRLLSEGVLNVAETAYKCGFKTPQYMAMVFKEHTGLTPKEYASRHRGKM